MTRDPRPVWNDPEPEDEALAGFFRPRSADPIWSAGCPPPELLQASRAGVLPPQVQERAARHVEHCVVCQTLGEALDDPSVGSLTPDEHDRVLTRIHAELSESRHAPGRSLFRLWPAVAATVSLAAIGSMLFLLFNAAPSQVPPSVLQLEKAPIQAGGTTDLVWRGATDSEAEELAGALEPYAADDFAEAARRLKALVRRYPQSAAGHFYLGVSELIIAADAEAVSALEQAERLGTGNRDLVSDAAWYLALAYRRTGEVERAAAKLTALCRGGSARAASACTGLAELSKGRSGPAR